MDINKDISRRIPTNIISGFLGVGKTSAILNLLAQKPETEHWAILVNEFGEIGIDGSLLEGNKKEGESVAIFEVPGGCMCCTAGLSMQIALSRLLANDRPDRLLIEPTGLGHPREVLKILCSESYKNVLSVQKTLTLVDARKLRENRFVENEIFQQQIVIADTIIGNKMDLYDHMDEEILRNYVKQINGPITRLVFTENADIDVSELDGTSLFESNNIDDKPMNQHDNLSMEDNSFPESGYVKAINNGDGFSSIGWRFSPEKVFSYQKLFTLFDGLIVDRMKAVLITDNGVFGFNLTPDAFTETEFDECSESRIELISESIDDSFEEGLFDCIQ